MPVQHIDPKRAVEITGPSYGSGYRIGGRLVLTARHVLIGSVDNACKVRARDDFGEVEARVVWKAPGADVALVQLPETVPECHPVIFGRLPAAGQIPATIPFELYGWPQWARTTRRGERSKAGGRHIRGTIYLADTSPEGLLVIEPERGPDVPDPRAQDSEWTGISGAAVVCNGLVVAVQYHHQNPRRAASLEAELLSKVYDDPAWRSLLEQHGIHDDPVAVLEEPPQRLQAYCDQVKSVPIASQAPVVETETEAAFQHQRELLRIKERRLQILERQAATYGLNCPPEIAMQIEDLRREIVALSR